MDRWEGRLTVSIDSIDHESAPVYPCDGPVARAGKEILYYKLHISLLK